MLPPPLRHRLTWVTLPSLKTTKKKKEEVSTNATEAAVTTTEMITTTTTTEAPHPVCGNNTDYKVFKIQFTPSSVNATYSFSSKESGAVFSSVEAGELPLDVMTEEKVCVPAGEYEYTMSSGACVNGFYRGQLILYSCEESTILVRVQDPQAQGRE
eukprot:scaffold211_cov208-Skeletonema_menzelii.AAC.1